MDNQQLVKLAAEIVSTYVSNNKINVGEVSDLVQRVHAALASLGSKDHEEPLAKVPVVSIRASIKPDRLICMECGRESTVLKRHLQTAHGMTPAEYRKDYGLPDSYPMVAPEYSDRRRDLAKSIGLGRKKKAPPALTTKRPGRKPRAAGPA
jgi:predicted transcriptional regulator